jgi:mannosyl-3-phosphoglycerate phosphatase
MPVAGRKKKTTPPPRPGLVVFSDIDGTLLDYYSYSYEPAKAAVRELRRRGIPLVLVSSKTRAEIMALRETMGLDSPFVAENGGMICWPKECVKVPPKGAKENGKFWVKSLGTSYAEVREKFVALREESGLKCEGFGDMSAERVTELTGLPPRLVPLAMDREFDEPFVFHPSVSKAAVEEHLIQLSSNGLSVLTGARFFHLVGKVDKGCAVRELLKWYGATQPVPPRTMAFGDSPSDWAMMKECDIAIAVKRADGRYHPELRAHKGIRLAGAPGPEGFNRMTLRLIKQLL